MKYNALFYVFSLSLLSACGGGSSSTGGAEQSRDLTFCVNETLEEREVNSITDGSVLFRVSEYTYTNGCNEPVNLSIVNSISSTIETVTLATNASHEDSTTVGSLRFIACRPPSVGIDGDLDTFFTQLSCS